MEVNLCACVRYDSEDAAAFAAMCLRKNSRPDDSEGIEATRALVIDALEFTEFAEEASSSGREVRARWLLGSEFVEDARVITQDLIASGALDVIYLLQADEMERVLLRNRGGERAISDANEHGLLDASQDDDEIYSILAAIRDDRLRLFSIRQR